MDASSRAIYGMLSIIIGAGIWGLFWIPLRYLDEQGISGFWAISMVTGGGLLLAIPVAMFRRDFSLTHVRDNLIIGIGIGLSTVLYFTGVLVSDVIRVIFLFYLLPIWTALISKFVFGETLGNGRIASIIIAIIGVWLLIGEGKSLPVPKNIGDWCGIAAGLLWGISLTLIKNRDDAGSFASVASTFFFAFLFSVILAFGFSIETQSLIATDISFANIVNYFPLAIAFGALVLWPSMIGQVWGAQIVSAPLAALLTMSEIIFATLSAWLLIGVFLSTISIIGGALIICAVLIDIYWSFTSSKN